MANQRAYTVKCYKGRRKSAMYGRGWRKFYEDNNLGKGQMVVFFLDEPSPRAAICVIQVGSGSEDEQPMEEGDPIEDSDSDDEDGEASSDDGEGIVRTRGLLLNEIEDAQLQGLLPLSDGFIGFAFVHRLTRTDIRLGMMVCISLSSFFLFFVCVCYRHIYVNTQCKYDSLKEKGRG